MTLIYTVICLIFTYRFIWVRNLVCYPETTQIEGIRSAGENIWIAQTEVPYHGAEK
jgi:hypothetical protein